MSQQVTLIDYGIGNVGSVSRAFEVCGANVHWAKSPEDLQTAVRLVLPGVGGFREGMHCLEAGGWVPAIREAALERRLPFLGICLGMHLMADLGKEGGETIGLALIPGQVLRLTPQLEGERIPHVGWNEVICQQTSPLFEGIPDQSDFYFVHSYHFQPTLPETAVATTPYCGGFTSVIQQQNLFGVQFHPEKSAQHGLMLLRQFLAV